MTRTKPLTRKAPLRRSTKRMKQGRSTGTPTNAERARFDAIKAIGCIVAHELGIYFLDENGERQPVPCEIHHLTVGGRHGQKRRGHLFTVGLNPWLHRGVPFGGMDAVSCQMRFGPSYAREPRRFREEVGDDERLLTLQNKLIGELK